VKSTIKVKQRQGKKEPQVLEGGTSRGSNQKEYFCFLVNSSWDSIFFHNWDNIREIAAVSWQQNG